MEMVGTSWFGKPLDQPLQSETKLQKIGILGLVDLPHFVKGQHPTTCIKHLLSVTHGGDIWLDNIVSIDIDLIANTTGFLTQGMDLA
jgi:hypothetical protein